MEPSKDPIAVRITRLNRLILGKVTSGSSKFIKKTIDREALLDALTVLYDECNDDSVKKCDELVRAFVDKYRSTLAELRRARVCISDFEVLQTIGRGHFGEVHMVREKQTGDVYALKTLRKEQARKRAGGAAEDERDVLATANGPWVPKLQYAFQDNNHLYLVMELCSGGDLAGLLARRNHPLSERDAAFYVAEVAHALKALHAMGYVHRDIKPHNILLDRCGHVKLGDFGSCARLSDGALSAVPVGTPDYVAPELLAAADCAARHAVCSEYCRGIVSTAISACDYWSLGVVAFELVTLKRPFSSSDDDTLSEILSNVQQYERDPNPEPPFEPSPLGPSAEWRGLVAGLLRVNPSRRYNYLESMQHPALQHICMHSIRDQAPPWVPCVRGSEDASLFSPPPRVTPPASAAPFRARPPFAGQLPFVGYSYVAPEENEETLHSSGFNASHDCTAIDLATFKSSEKLAAMRAKEIASLQNKLAAAESASHAAADKVRRSMEAEAERTRAKLQAEITALSLQNKRLERQLEVEKEERMAVDRANQELTSALSSRSSVEMRSQQQAAEVTSQRAGLLEDVRRLESKVAELQSECARANAEADTVRAQQKHYKDILEHVKDLRHRRISEINVRPIDTIAKERALRRQTLSGGEAESREAAARVAAAEAALAKEKRNCQVLEKKLVLVEAENGQLKTELEHLKRDLTSVQDTASQNRRLASSSSQQIKELQQQLAQEKTRATMLAAQVQELERGIEEAGRREASLEEQTCRTEARLHARARDAEAGAARAAQQEHAHKEKVNALEQLVRKLERDVTALESKRCGACDAPSDMESAGSGSQQARGTALMQQLERTEAQLQARIEEMAALRQEARAANLARWRKEREYTELQTESKSTARDLKRAEERLNTALEARKKAEQKATALQSELATLKPQYEREKKEAETVKEQYEKLRKVHDTMEAEIDRSRNDIRKLKSELQYSEKRRIHAEEQEELSSRERAQLRDELVELRAQYNDTVANNKALQEACSMLEDQLSDLEKIADLHENNNHDLEAEVQRLRTEVASTRSRLSAAEQAAAERGVQATRDAQQHHDYKEQLERANLQITLLNERIESHESRVAELECQTGSLECEKTAAEAALNAAMRRMRDLQEECACLRTRAHEHHSLALQLQASLAEAQEELSSAREASAAAAAWWRTRDTKAAATLRQQAKLIDFLQAKVEEAGRKKCSFGNKLFGRSGRRAASPPLRRANRELREEVERLRAKLAAQDSNNMPPSTPLRDKSTFPQTPTSNRIKMDIDTPDCPVTGDTVQIVWPDGSRERRSVRYAGDALRVTLGEGEARAALLAPAAPRLPQHEAGRAFTVKLDKCDKAASACLVWSSVAERSKWLNKLSKLEAAGYQPSQLLVCADSPNAAVYLGPDATAIGSDSGLHSLRGPIHVQLEADGSPPRRERAAVRCVAQAAGRALLVYSGILVQASLMSFTSTLRRSSALNPTLSVTKVRLPEITAPHLVKAISGDCTEGPCAAVACGRRVFLLRFDASTTEFKIARSSTVDRPPNSLLLTPTSLYIAGEKPLKINLPSGALEAFGMDEPIIAAAAKKHSPPRAILLIRDQPTEILLCYSECGVFVDANGKRTRNEDPKWSCAVHGWEYVHPFLYIIGEDKVTIVYVTDEAYRAPPCTCDSTSLTSSASECCSPEVFNLKVEEPALLGTTPTGIIIRSKTHDGYKVSIVEGMAAFRSVGASVESLESVDTRRSSSDLARSISDVSNHEISRESVEVTTGFLADIRKTAKQMREKKGKENSSEEFIKQILRTEVSLKRPSNGRKSPATTSEFDSDSESEDQSDQTKQTADLCAEMFTRQVRFQ